MFIFYRTSSFNTIFTLNNLTPNYLPYLKNLNKSIWLPDVSKSAESMSNTAGPDQTAIEGLH